MKNKFVGKKFLKEFVFGEKSSIFELVVSTWRREPTNFLSKSVYSLYKEEMKEIFKGDKQEIFVRGKVFDKLESLDATQGIKVFSREVKKILVKEGFRTYEIL